MAYIGLDVGTSGCKASVVSPDGAVLFSKSKEYRFELPQPGWVELNPQIVWQAVREVLAAVAPSAKDVRAMAVSTLGEAMVFLDAQEKPLCNGIVYLDDRCPDIPAWIAQKTDPYALYLQTGLSNNQMFSLCRYLWLRKNRPNIVEQAKYVFLFEDYIQYLLTGERAVDPSMASRTMLFDIRTGNWADNLFSLFDVPMEKFSPVVPAGTVLGRLRRELAQELGLPQSIQVVVGCHDQIAANLGSGITQPGEMLAGEGSTESFNLIIDHASVEQRDLYAREICIEPFAVPGRFMLPLGQLSHGSCIRWFVQLHAHEYETRLPGEDLSLYQKADKLCAQNSHGLYFIPYLSKVLIMDASNRAPACFLGIDASTTVDRMYRAVLEGLSFEARNVLDIARDAGANLSRIVATGGGSRSDLFMQLKSDVIGLPVETLAATDGGSVGLAALCAYALGDVPDLDSAARKFSKISRRFEPSRNYDAQFAAYRKILSTLKALYREL